MNLHKVVMNIICGIAVATNCSASLAGGEDIVPARYPMETWRASNRLIDLHQHMDYSPDLLARAVRIMDASGIGLGVDLTPGTVTRGPNGSASEFEIHKKLEDTLFPGRFVQYMNLDFANWDDADFSLQAVRQVEEGHRLGAAGYKDWKRFGLGLRDRTGKLISIDDPRLDLMWDRLGELSMPVSIHVGDPKAFFEPYNDKNERWAELKDHPKWWFGDTNQFPSYRDLLEALNRVIARHPKTTFVCVHFGNNAEDLDWVGKSLDAHPNMHVDLAARIPELGRHDPRKVHEFFVKYQDRILFGTDFQSLESKIILGSSGDEPPPTEADAEVFFKKEYRWLETWDRNWDHMTPIQGNWKISAIGLPSSVLRKIYFDNARRLLARSLPTPVTKARHTTVDFSLDGDLTKPIWQTTPPVIMDLGSLDGAAHPDFSTSIRCLWSDNYLYLAYRCPYTKLSIFESAKASGKRVHLDRVGESLWDRDVIEAFIGTNPLNVNDYYEFEVAPNNERLDVRVNLPEKDFTWTSHFESVVTVSDRAWDCEMRIPLSAITSSKPTVGTRWRLNCFRCDRANRTFLAWRPVMQGSFHVPERSGWLEFAD